MSYYLNDLQSKILGKDHYEFNQDLFNKIIYLWNINACGTCIKIEI